MIWCIFLFEWDSLYTSIQWIHHNASGYSPEERWEWVVYMQQVFVKFDDADQVRNFVNAVSSVDANFELGSGRRVVDPKSILGVFALDLARPQRLVCDSDDSAMLDKISPYLLQGTACWNQQTVGSGAEMIVPAPCRGVLAASCLWSSEAALTWFKRMQFHACAIGTDWYHFIFILVYHNKRSGIHWAYFPYIS